MRIRMYQAAGYPDAALLSELTGFEPIQCAFAAGTLPACTLWQRINVMQVFRLLSADPNILLFYLETYDLKEVWPGFLTSCMHRPPRQPALAFRAPS